MKALHMVAFVLTIVGGVNWGLVGLGWLAAGDAGAWNVVHMILSSVPQVEAIVYILVGLSAVWLLVTHKNDCRHCSSGGAM